MNKLLPALTLTLCASVALAEPPAPRAAEALVEQKVVAPLAKAEAKRSRFSRAAPVPVQRRVRMLDTVAVTDARGQAFVRFAVDVRRFGLDEDAWQSDTIVGCAYPQQRKVFVEREGAYYPASSLLDGEGREQPGACRPADELAQQADAAPPRRS
jgi:hypothetical protein